MHNDTLHLGPLSSDSARSGLRASPTARDLLGFRDVAPGAARARTRSGSGLVYTAISQKALNEVRVFENCIEVKSGFRKAPKLADNRLLKFDPVALQRSIQNETVDPPVRRERISEFSPRARSRLIRKVNKASFIRDGGYFATLTYPREYSLDWQVWKKHLNHFLVLLRQLAARHGWDFRYLWKLEFQRRGAPHFHLMLFGIPREFYFELLAWVSLHWYQVVGSGDDRHLRAGTNVRRMTTAAHVAAYVGKYLSKSGDNIPGYTGRFWGTSRSWDMPAVVLYLTDRQVVKLRRLLRRYLQKKGALRYARRLRHLRAFFVVGVGPPLTYRALANMQAL